jgi:NADH-quinone oxidoreductase subunit D
MLRGSLDRTQGDLAWDLRKTEPYCGYENYDFKAAVPPFTDTYYDDAYGTRPRTPRGAVIGDAWHRFYVRMLEVVESIKIVEQALKKYATAAGSHRIDAPKHLPPGEAYVETECPRGQMGFYVVGRNTKESVPLRVRARSSSFCNLSVTDEICRNCLVADVPAIVGSIDIVMGEIDR